MNKKKYVKPVLETEEFVPQEYIAACYEAFSSDNGGILVAKVPGGKYTPNDGTGMDYEYYQIATVNTSCVGQVRPDKGGQDVFFTRDQPTGHLDETSTPPRFYIDEYAFQIESEGWTPYMGESHDLKVSACYFRRPNSGDAKNFS